MSRAGLTAESINPFTPNRERRRVHQAAPGHQGTAGYAIASQSNIHSVAKSRKPQMAGLGDLVEEQERGIHSWRIAVDTDRVNGRATD
jgi:hypothetical protein